MSSAKMGDSSRDRLLQMLTHSLGSELVTLLDDDRVVELMLNPDGCLWVERLGQGCQNTGVRVAAAMARQTIELIASATNTVCNEERPILSAELPGSGHRFEGILPPVVIRPTFSIRKKAVMVFTLTDYVRNGILTEQQKEVIIKAVQTKQNILVAGGTGSGKTTLLNAILAEIARTNDRIVVIEDTLELQCTAPNTVFLRSQVNVSMNQLLKSTLRLRPDRIVVGEVRGGEALTLIKSWNTGHPGGCASLHANDCPGALTRLESLVLEVSQTPQEKLIAKAINLIINIEKTDNGRKVNEIAGVAGISNGEYILNKI